MNKTNVYTLKVDTELDGKFRALKERFQPGEKIVSTNTENGMMIIITEVGVPSKNLLLG